MKILVLGLGSIGQRHGANFLSLGCDVTGIDPSTEACKTFQDKGGKIATDRFDAMQNADAVVIASPNQYHAQDMRDAVNYDCHLFVEKPMASVLDGLEDILKKADDKKLKVFAAMSMRFCPAVLSAKKFLEDGNLGKIAWARCELAAHLPSWRPHQDYSKGYTADPKTGGVIFDIIHGFDVMNYLFGDYEIKGAMAHNSGFLNIPSDDCADILIKHIDQNIPSTIHLDYISKPQRSLFYCVGEKGWMTINYIERSVTFKNNDGVEEILFKADTAVAQDYIDEAQAFIHLWEGKNIDYCTGWDAFSILSKVIQSRQLAGLPSL